MTRRSRVFAVSQRAPRLRMASASDRAACHQCRAEWSVSLRCGRQRARGRNSFRRRFVGGRSPSSNAVSATSRVVSSFSTEGRGRSTGHKRFTLDRSRVSQRDNSRPRSSMPTRRTSSQRKSCFVKPVWIRARPKNGASACHAADFRADRVRTAPIARRPTPSRHKACRLTLRISERFTHRRGGEEVHRPGDLRLQGLHASGHR